MIAEVEVLDLQTTDLARSAPGVGGEPDEEAPAITGPRGVQGPREEVDLRRCEEEHLSAFDSRELHAIAWVVLKDAKPLGGLHQLMENAEGASHEVRPSAA